MTRNQQIADIRQKCIEANPEIVRQSGGSKVSFDIEREVRLADVLLAIEEKFKFSSNFLLTTEGKHHLVNHEFINGKLIHERYWDFRKDDLTLSSDECINFIHSLLCK